MRANLLWDVAVAILVTMAAASPMRADDDDAAATPEQAAKKPGPAITISKETTRVLGPLRDDGYVDYLAAINEHCSRGVTPENNAVVLYWQAMGPEGLGEAWSERYFRLLGVQPPAEQGRYLVPFDKFVQKRGQRQPRQAGRDDRATEHDPEDQRDRAMASPWSEDEFPVVAKWLSANEKPLVLLMEASKRPRYYSPLECGGERGMVIAALLPVAQGSREVGRAFTARAMLRVHEGNIDSAWEDLLAAHRWARLAGQGPTLVQALVGIAVDGIAGSGSAALAQSGKLSAEQARRFRHDLRKLAPLPKMADKLDVSERFLYLDVVATVARQRPAAMEYLWDQPVPKKRGFRDTLMRWATNLIVNWDEVLRSGNKFYDRLVEACRIPDRARRLEVSSALEEEIKQLEAEVTDPKAALLELLAGNRAVVTKRMSGVFLALLTPALMAATEAEDRGATRHTLIHVALALDGYRSDHGAYPPDLSALSPKYIEKLPKDIYTGKDFRYRRQDGGYLVYSLGKNGEDDDGRNRHMDAIDWDDPKYDDYEGDDIAIRTATKRP